MQDPFQLWNSEHLELSMLSCNLQCSPESAYISPYKKSSEHVIISDQLKHPTEGHLVAQLVTEIKHLTWSQLMSWSLKFRPHDDIHGGHGTYLKNKPKKTWYLDLLYKYS